MKRLLLLFVLYGVLACAGIVGATAQTTLYNENFDGVGAPALPTGYTATAGAGTWATTASAGSSGYTGASGSNNMIGTNGATLATYTVTYDNTLSTVGYTAITVLWGARRTSSFTNAATFEWSINGTTWNPVSYTEVANNSTWALVNGGTRFALPGGAEGAANLRFRWTFTQIAGTGNYRIDDFTVEGTASFVADGSGSASLVNNAGTYLNSDIFTRNTGSQNVKLTIAGVAAGDLDKVKVTVPAGWTGLLVGNITLGGEFTGKTPIVAGNDIQINSAALRDTGGTITVTGLTSANPSGALLNGNDTWVVQTAIAAGTLTSIASSPKSFIIVPISNLRTGGVDGFGNTSSAGDTSAINGQTVAVSGVALVENQIISSSPTQTSFFIQESGYGLQVFDGAAPSTVFARGDQITVKGPIVTFQGSTEIDPVSTAAPHFFNLGAGSLPGPVVVTNATDINESKEGQLVQINSVTYDSAGQVFITTATGNPDDNFHKTSASDTSALYLSSANAVVGITIPATGDLIGIVYHRKDIVGVGQPPHKLAPRDQVDIGLNPADGTGTAVISPVGRLASETAKAETVYVTGESFTIGKVSVTIPSSWTWTSTAARALSGAGFSSALSSVTGTGTGGDPYVISITSAAVTSTDVGKLVISSLNTPGSAETSTFSVKTAASVGTLTNINPQPIVTIVTDPFEVALANGNWSDPGTWTGGAVPTLSDNVSMSILYAGVTVDIGAATCNNLTMAGIGSASNSGPLLQFQASGSPQLTINGALSITGGSGSTGNRAGRPKFTSNGNSSATLIVKGSVTTTSSNSTANGDAGLNMHEGTVKLTGATSDTLYNGAGLRLANLEIGDGSNAKTLVTAPTTNATMTIRSLNVKDGSSLWLGTATGTSVLTLGNSITSGLPVLNGGITVGSGASIDVQESAGGFVQGTINLDGGGITNSGTIDLISGSPGAELTGCVYHVRIGGNPQGTAGVSQSVGGTGTGTYANVTIDSSHTLTLNQDMMIASFYKMTITRGTLAETDGNTVIGKAEATRTVGTLPETFGGIGFEITAGGAGSTTVTRTTGTQAVTGTGSSIARYFDVNNALGTSLTFRYDNSEIAGQDAATFQLYKSTNSGGSWSAQGGTPSPGSKTVTVTGVTSSGRWTAADTSNPLGSFAVNVSVTAGWNMVSNPVTTSSDSVKQVFPTSSFNYAFAFIPASGYQQDFTMETGTGYWAKFPGATSQSVSGNVLAADTIPVSAGWNMIGALSTSIDTGTVVTVPSGIRSSVYFGYAAGYVTAATLDPGAAYWVKSSAGGNFILKDFSAPAEKASRVNLLDGFSSITITDAAGASQTLYLGNDRNGNFPVDFFEMPPQGPEGAFDSRFESERMVEVSRGGQAAQHGIRVTTVAYPLTVSWNVADGKLSLSDGVNPVASMSGNGQTIVRNPSVKRLVVSTEGTEVPTVFSLQQNYPNPFNPATTIRFGIPSNSKVTLRVYNLLGQQVAELVNGVLESGYHELNWEANTNTGSVSSGVYFYKLVANSLTNGQTFSEVHKMMLLK